MGVGGAPDNLVDRFLVYRGADGQHRRDGVDTDP